MKILALDPSLSSSGWIVTDQNLSIENSGLIKTSNAMSRDDRLFKIYNEFIYLLNTNKPDVIVMEDYPSGFSSGKSSTVSISALAQAQAIIRLAIKQYKITYFAYHVATIRAATKKYYKLPKTPKKADIPSLTNIPDQDIADAFAAAICYNKQTNFLVTHNPNI